MQLIFSSSSNGGKTTELDDLLDRAMRHSNSSTSNLWHHILSSIFPSVRWPVVTGPLTVGNEYRNVVEICVHRFIRSKERVPFLLWIGRRPLQSGEDQDTVEAVLEEQARKAGWQRLEKLRMEVIWVMTSLGGSAKLWVLCAGKKGVKGKQAKLIPVWPFEATSNFTWLRNLQNVNDTPWPGSASREILKEERLHGATSSAALDRISEGDSSTRRNVRVLQAGREMPGPGHAAREPHSNGWDTTDDHIIDWRSAVPDAYNNIKTYAEAYELILAHIKENKYPKRARRMPVGLRP